MTPDYETQIEDICNNMNWFKIQMTMKALSWEWAGISGIPNEYQIEEAAEELLIQLSQKEGDGNLSTGGLEARKESGILSLRFVVESYPY
jgi:hypothetical protein